jgi:hypothetical protein
MIASTANDQKYIGNGSKEYVEAIKPIRNRLRKYDHNSILLEIAAQIHRGEHSSELAHLGTLPWVAERDYRFQPPFGKLAWPAARGAFRFHRSGLCRAKSAPAGRLQPSLLSSS